MRIVPSTEVCDQPIGFVVEYDGHVICDPTTYRTCEVIIALMRQLLYVEIDAALEDTLFPVPPKLNLNNFFNR